MKLPRLVIAVLIFVAPAVIISISRYEGEWVFPFAYLTSVIFLCGLLFVVVLVVGPARGIDQRAPDGLFIGLRRILASLGSFLFPQAGRCQRCRMPWTFTKPHITPTQIDNMCFFALCQSCWASLTAEQRIPYYFARIAIMVARGYCPNYATLKCGRVINLDVEGIRDAVYEEAGQPAPEWFKDGAA
jgi:hypothetical protein